MGKTVLKFGLIAGAIVSVLMLIPIAFMGFEGNMQILEILGYTSMLISLSFVFIGVKSYRDKQRDGTIGFWRALGVGVLITFVASIIYVASWMIYKNVSDVDFISVYKEHMIADIQQSGVSQQQIDFEIASMEQMMELYENPVIQILFTFMEIFPVGLLVALISAAILTRRKRKEAVPKVS